MKKNSMLGAVKYKGQKPNQKYARALVAHGRALERKRIQRNSCWFTCGECGFREMVSADVAVIVHRHTNGSFALQFDGKRRKGDHGNQSHRRRSSPGSD